MAQSATVLMMICNFPIEQLLSCPHKTGKVHSRPNPFSKLSLLISASLGVMCHKHHDFLNLNYDYKSLTTQTHHIWHRSYILENSYPIGNRCIMSSTMVPDRFMLIGGLFNDLAFGLKQKQRHCLSLGRTSFDPFPVNPMIKAFL